MRCRISVFITSRATAFGHRRSRFSRITPGATSRAVRGRPTSRRPNAAPIRSARSSTGSKCSCFASLRSASSNARRCPTARRSPPAARSPRAATGARLRTARPTYGLPSSSRTCRRHEDIENRSPDGAPRKRCVIRDGWPRISLRSIRATSMRATSILYTPILYTLAHIPLREGRLPMLDFATRVHNHNYRLDPIIRSLLDTDFYKFLMHQFIWMLYPDVPVTFSLINRTSSVRLAELVPEALLRAQLDYVRDLRFQENELIWLAGNRFYGRRDIFRPEYIEYLRAFRLPDYRLERRDGQYVLTFEGRL